MAHSHVPDQKVGPVTLLAAAIGQPRSCGNLRQGGVMRRIIVLLLAFALMSCAQIPEPETSEPAVTTDDVKALVKAITTSSRVQKEPYGCSIGFIEGGREIDVFYHKADKKTSEHLVFWVRPEGGDWTTPVNTFEDDGPDGIVDRGVIQCIHCDDNLEKMEFSVPRTYGSTVSKATGPQYRARWQALYNAAVRAALKHFGQNPPARTSGRIRPS